MTERSNTTRGKGEVLRDVKMDIKRRQKSSANHSSPRCQRVHYVLLVLILIFTSSSALSMEDEHQSGICGCPMEIRESFHEDRIPSKIVERVCHQVGITCGASLDRAPFSSVSNNYHAKKVIFFAVQTFEFWTK